MTASRPRSFDDLAATLSAQDVAFRRPGDGSVLEIPTVIAGRSGRVVVSWDPTSRLLSVHAAMPGLEVPAEHVAAVEHTITYLNHESVLPGFQIDPVNRRVSFRAVVPGEPWSLVRRLVERVQSTVDRYYARVAAAARGELTEDVAR
jgi:hypothetical protein